MIHHFLNCLSLVMFYNVLYYFFITVKYAYIYLIFVSFNFFGLLYFYIYFTFLSVRVSQNSSGTVGDILAFIFVNLRGNHVAKY